MSRVASGLVVAPASLVDFDTTADRARLIVELRRAGWTYVAVGRVVGLSRQRVAQIDRKWQRRIRLGTASAA